MKSLMLSVLLSFGVAGPAHAHEGHSHGGSPKAAPHGGTLKETREFFLETVSEPGGVRVYLFNHDMQPAADVELSGSYRLPKKKPEKLSFRKEQDAFFAPVDAKGAHRYQLSLELRAGKKQDKVELNVEPK